MSAAGRARTSSLWVVRGPGCATASPRRPAPAVAVLLPVLLGLCCFATRSYATALQHADPENPAGEAAWLDGLQAEDIRSSEPSQGAHTHARRLAGRKKVKDHSEYVSKGQVSSFTGDVYPTPSLALALANRSYKKEVILLTDSRPRAALQTYYQLADMGLVHVLWLTAMQQACEAAAELHQARASGAIPGGRQLHQQQGGATHHRRLSGSHGSHAAPTSSARTLQQAAATGGTTSTAASTADGDYLGCAWCSQPFPAGFSGHRRLMLKRIMLLARAVRLGYNVLSMDTDVLVYRDPYLYLKAPPYDSMHLVVGKSVVGVVVNTGVLYVQNAAQHGPVAWLLAEVVDRNLRWIEHNVSMPHMQASGGGKSADRAMPAQADSRGCWDQFLFGDVVLTSMTGKLVLWYCARPSGGDKGGGKARRGGEADSWTGRHRAAMGLADTGGPRDLMVHEETSVEGNEAMTSLVGSTKYSTEWVNLTIPHNPPPLLPDEPGYSLPSVRPGKAAESFQQVLVSDAKHVELHRRRGASRRRSLLATLAGAAGGGDLTGQLKALWSRHLTAAGSSGAAGAAGGGGRAPVMERMAYAADWLVGSWVSRGALGYWDPSLNKLPKQVFGHLVRAPGPTHVGKDAVRMAYGKYDWQLARLTAGGPMPFMGWPDPGALPKVVALAPGVDTTTTSPHQWGNMARGLVQVALLTGRLVVWPSVRCTSSWVQPNPAARRSVPLSSNLKFFASGNFKDGLSCTPASVFHQKCLYEKHVVAKQQTAASATGGAASGGGKAAKAGGGGADSLHGAEAVGAALAAGTMGWDLDGGAEFGEYATRVEGPRGLLPVEFAELLRLLGNATYGAAAGLQAGGAGGGASWDVTPGAHNTLELAANDDYDADERPIMFDEPPRTPGVTYVRAADALPRLQRLADQPVLYLGQRTFLTQLDKVMDANATARYRMFKHECPALK